jgi:uncharacterized protein (TIGR02646 family)
MHKVQRNEAPLELIEKDREWKEQLRTNPDLKPNWEQFSRTTLKKKVLKQLKSMYGGCCCYCEGEPSSVSYAEIEHFKAKSIFPELCYDYSNLHFSCKRCNLAKSDEFNELLIDSSVDEPENYIHYVGELAAEIDNNERGKKMIEVLKLNDRADLREERSKYLSIFTKNYDLIIHALETVLANEGNEGLELIRPFIHSFIAEVTLKSKHGESYCTMIKHNFSDKIEMLKEV